MVTANLFRALDTLRSELARGEDVYESQPLVHEVAREFGGQALLCGNPERVEQLLAALPKGVEPEIVFELFRISTMYADDGGRGLRQVAATWAGSQNPHKAFIAEHKKELAFE